MAFSKLKDIGNKIFYTYLKKNFFGIDFENTSIIKDSLNFAHDMTFGNVGEHRNHRTGGTHRRKNSEIFANTFQGKLSECAIFQVLKKNNLNPDKPNFEKYKLGNWDTGDIVINDKKLGIKSAKSFSNLLMLEVGDWDEKGNYLQEGKIDIFILVRIEPSIDKIMKNLLLYNLNLLDKNNKLKLFEIEKIKWKFDIPGFVTNEDIIEVIKLKNIIPKGHYLNSKYNKIDADNYYIQSGDLRDISTIKNFLT